MTKKDYIKAAEIVRRYCESKTLPLAESYATAVEESFIELFYGDNPRFDEKRFREACKPACDKVAKQFGKPCSRPDGHEGKCNS